MHGIEGKMKVLLVVWNFYQNTAYSNHTKATVRGFRESGVQCDVFSIKPLFEADDIVLNKKFVGARNYVKTAFAMSYNYMALTSIAKNYDVIYCATSDLRVIKRLLSFAKRNNKVIVHERTEYPDVFMPSECAKMREYCKYVAKFDKIFTISTYIKNFFANRGVENDKLQVYPMIVDPHRFDCIEKQDVGYRYIAYCGNLQNSKDGVSDLIEAYGITEYAKKIFKLVLIGKKPSEEEMSTYKAAIDKHKLTNKVIFTGQVQYYEIPQMLKNADVLALCRPDSHQAEGGFPTKLGEYLSTGNPVLVTKVGDIELYIKDGINGFVSEPNNIQMFRNKLDLIATHYDDAKLIGLKGVDLVHGSFNYKKQTNIILQSIKTIISKR